MQNILKRPMFRKGGLSTTTRTGYSEAGSAIADAKELMEIENMRDPFSDFDMSEETIKETIKEKSQPKSREELMRIAMQDTGIMDQFIKPKKDRRLANLALRFGAGLADPNLRGSFLQKVAQAGAGAVPGLIKETDAMDAEAAGIDALKMKRFMDIYDREELRDYKQSQAEDGIDDQETAFMKNVAFASEALYPGRNFAELAEEEQRRVIAMLNKDVTSDAEKQDKYLSGIYEIAEAAPKLSNFGDDYELFGQAVAEYENKARNKIRSQKIHGDLLSSGKIDGIDITTVSILDGTQGPIRENVLYEIAVTMTDSKTGEKNIPDGARYLYIDRDDATNVQQTIYLDSGFNPII